MSDDDKTLVNPPEDSNEDEGWQQAPGIPPESEPVDLTPKKFAARAMESASKTEENKPEPGLEAEIMDTDYEAPLESLDEPKKNNTLLVVILVVLLVLCCCCVAAGMAGWWLYNNGDELFGLTNLAAAFLT